MNRSLLAFFIFAFLILNQGLSFAAGPRDTFQNGDLIFQKSSSSQALAISEATRSPWTHVGILMRDQKQWFVIEAIEPVQVSTLDRFIDRGLRKEYRVYRHRALAQMDRADVTSRLKEELAAFIGLPYDIFFEWSDQRIYCSELVYKAFQNAFEIDVGQMQKFKDLYLDGPYVKRLIKDRLDSIGKKLDLEQPIVTPATQIESPDLRLIYKSH